MKLRNCSAHVSELPVVDEQLIKDKVLPGAVSMNEPSRVTEIVSTCCFLTPISEQAHDLDSPSVQLRHCNRSSQAQPESSEMLLWSWERAFIVRALTVRFRGNVHNCSV